MKQVIVLSHFLTHTQILPQGSPGRTVQMGCLRALSGQRGLLLCPTAHRVPTGTCTYLLQLPAVSFSRRTLFIFCINYSESWAGQETGEEEGRKEISYNCWVKSIFHRSHFQLSGEVQINPWVSLLGPNLFCQHSPDKSETESEQRGSGNSGVRLVLSQKILFKIQDS